MTERLVQEMIESSSAEDFTIEIEAQDWYQEYIDTEPDTTSIEAAINWQIENGASPQQVARMLIVARELDIAPHDIIPTNKPLLNLGAAKAWSQQLAERKEECELENGKVVQVRKLVGPVSHKDEDQEDKKSEETRWVRRDDPQANEREVRYLVEIVPGHIYPRLAAIAANQGDVREPAEKLKAKIDDIVAELT